MRYAIRVARGVDCINGTAVASESDMMYEGFLYEMVEEICSKARGIWSFYLMDDVIDFGL
jgi:hypothetical protein